MFKKLDTIFMYGFIGFLYVFLVVCFFGVIFLMVGLISGIAFPAVGKPDNKNIPIKITISPTVSLLDMQSPPTFGGNPCTVDCSGHEAGYEWAEKHGVTDPDDCGGKSQSFIEGCQSYAEEN